MARRKIPWTSQPQYPVGIDRANPYASYFSAFLYPVGNTFHDACQGEMRRGTNTSVSSNVASVGKVLQFDGTTSEINYGDVSLVDFPSGYSIFVLFCPEMQTGARNEQLVAKDHETGRQFVVELNSLGQSGSGNGQTGSIGHIKFTSNSTWSMSYSAANVVTNGQWYSLLIGCPNSLDNIQAFLNGSSLSLTSSYSSTGAVQATSTNLYIGRRNYTGYNSFFGGKIAAVAILRTPPTLDIAQKLYRNPWQFLAPRERRIFVSVASSGVTGTLTSTLDSFTSNLSGTTTIVGSINNTFSSFTSSITGSSTIVGQIAYTNQNVTSNITGTTAVVGQIAVTNQDSTSNITGNVGSGTTGTINSTLQNSTSSIQGTTQITGTMSVVMGSFTSVIQGTTTILGTISKTMDDFISSISGFIGEAKARLLSLLGVGS